MPDRKPGESRLQARPAHCATRFTATGETGSMRGPTHGDASFAAMPRYKRCPNVSHTPNLPWGNRVLSRSSPNVIEPPSWSDRVVDVMCAVAPGFSERVHPRGWDELGEPVVGDPDNPVPTVDLGMMQAAEQHPVT